MNPEYQRRRGFTHDATDPVEMNDVRRRYVHDFMESQGYRDVGLEDAQLAKVFRALVRWDEFGTLHKHHGHNWELEFLPGAQQQALREPDIDLRLQAWAESSP